MYSKLLDCFPKSSETIHAIEKLLNESEKWKVKEVSAKGPPRLYLLTWKLKSYVQTIIYRINELTDESLLAWIKLKPSVSFLLTRSVIETSAYLFDLANKLEKELNDDHNINKLTDLIDSWKFGEKNCDCLPNINNVLTIVKSLSKTFPMFDENYFQISSFCHPNYSAVGMLYSKQNMDELKFELGTHYGLREDLFNIIVISLYTSLEILKLAKNKLDRIYPIINELNKVEQEKHV